MSKYYTLENKQIADVLKLIGFDYVIITKDTKTVYTFVNGVDIQKAYKELNDLIIKYKNK